MKILKKKKIITIIISETYESFDLKNEEIEITFDLLILKG